MQHQTFDEKMRLRAQNERFTPSARAQQKLEEAMRKGAIGMAKEERHRQRWPRAAAFAALAAMMLLMVVMERPPNDQWDKRAVLSAQEISATPLPVTVPEGELHMTVENRMLRAEANFSNHTGDIWLIQWNAEPSTSVERISAPTDLIWLETGITFTDTASWKMFSQWEEQSAQSEWGYTGHRVDAKVLHWIEGEWLLPGEEGYEEQQMLIEDAFANGALILAPGDWPEGTSGEMQLVLPDSYQREHPEMDALSYYTLNGMLRRAVAFSEVIEIE